MATVSIYRTAFQRNAIPIGLSLTAGLALASRQQPIRLDSVYQAASVQPASTRGYSNEPKRRDRLNPEVLKQLSSGSLSGWFFLILTSLIAYRIIILTFPPLKGFVAGILVSVFSKTLVLLLGITIVLNQVCQLGFSPSNTTDAHPLPHKIGSKTLRYRHCQDAQVEAIYGILPDHGRLAEQDGL